MNAGNIQALSDQAIALIQSGNLAGAEQACIQLRQADPRNFIGCYLQGVIQFGRGERGAAKASMDAAMAAQPYAPQPFVYQGLLQEADGQDEQALASYGKALSLQPDMVEAMVHRGNLFHRRGRFANALADFNLAAKLRPDFLPALLGQGASLESLGRAGEALAVFDSILAHEPGMAPAWNRRAILLRASKRLEDALASIDKALSLQPDSADAWNDRGIILRDLKRPKEALACYDKALSHAPGHALAWNNRGVALHDLQQTDEALASYEKAVTIRPNYGHAWDNRGVVLLEQKRAKEALASFDKAVSFEPDYAEAWNNRAAALLALNRFAEALVSIDKASLLDPGAAKPWVNRAAALQELGRLEEALASADRALALAPDNSDAWNNRGNVLGVLKRPDEAAASYGKALALKPDFEFLGGHYLYAKAKACEWSGFGRELATFAAGVEAGKKILAPFPLLSQIDDPGLHKKVARIYAEARFPRNFSAVPVRSGSGKIRIGYYSADFHHHATCFLIAELLEAHDASRFELYGFSFGPEVQDDMRRRIAASFHEFLPVRDLSDKDIALLSRQRGIDIAVDLKGFTQESRSGIFAEGCAPLQVQYLGYPGTMGTDYLDYVIADRIVVPPGGEADYDEKVLRLPHSYQPNDSRRKISQRIFTRAEAGLPSSGFVFCCFNANFKILPDTFDSWMRILTAVEGSVLWLLEENQPAKSNLRREAAARGVDPARLIFAPFMAIDDHLARHRLADLFLDTLPYNAHTTASDALWAGLPVLTCMGKAFAGRVAASLLHALGLPELITHSPAEYEALAVALARDPERMEALKKRLADNRVSAPLFDGKLIARHLEAGYEAMLARHRAGLPPDHIEIAP